MNEIPTRRAWAPFVGAALAMLTTGSLVVFALVAQRTSLDGFSTDRIAVARPDDAAPSAITISPVGGSTSTGGPSGGPSNGADVASPEVPVTAPSFFEIVTTSPPPLPGPGAVALASGSDDATDDPGTVEAPNQRLAEEQALLALGGGGNGGDYEGAGDVADWDSKHDGKHSHRSHDARDKSKRSNRSNNAKKAKEQRSGARGSSSRRHASVKSTPSSASRSVRPAPKPQSSRVAKRSPAPPSHSRAGGNGRARGRGHGKH